MGMAGGVAWVALTGPLVAADALLAALRAAPVVTAVAAWFWSEGALLIDAGVTDQEYEPSLQSLVDLLTPPVHDAAEAVR